MESSNALPAQASDASLEAEAAREFARIKATAPLTTDEDTISYISCVANSVVQVLEAPYSDYNWEMVIVFMSTWWAMVLAEAVGPTGKVVAYDVDPKGRQTIAATAARLRLQGRISIIENPKQLLRADRVLVNPPCSETGNLSRRVEARRRLRPESFQQNQALQCRLLIQGLELCRLTTIGSTQPLRQRQ